MVILTTHLLSLAGHLYNDAFWRWPVVIINYLADTFDRILEPSPGDIVIELVQGRVLAQQVVQIILVKIVQFSKQVCA